MSAPALTNLTTLPPGVQEWLDKVLLSRPEPFLIHDRFAYKINMPSKSGRVARFRRYANLQTATVPLSDGITPPPQVLSAVNIDAQIDWYGTYTILTDQLTLQIQDPLLNENASLLGQSMRETNDELARDAMVSTTAQVDAVNGSNADLPTNIAFEDVQAAYVSLQNASARMISEQITGEDRFATAPIRPAYWAMATTQMIPSLEAVTGFVHESAYPSDMRSLHAEFGSIGNVRWLVSPLGSVDPNQSALGADVFNSPITGKESFGIVDLEGAFPQIYYQPLGWGNDPLHQRMTMGFKYAGAYRVLNDSWLLNVRSTAAA